MTDDRSDAEAHTDAGAPSQRPKASSVCYRPTGADSRVILTMIWSMMQSRAPSARSVADIRTRHGCGSLWRSWPPCCPSRCCCTRSSCNVTCRTRQPS